MAYKGRRKKVCYFCHTGREVDWRDARTLRRYLDARARIKTRRATGTCARHQRELSRAIKRARQMALLPYK